MILIWKGPAALIIILSVLAGALLGVGIGAMFGLSETALGSLVMFLVSIGILGGDIWYRNDNFMGPFDLESSTLFFIIPTWVIGALLFLFSVVGLFVPASDLG